MQNIYSFKAMSSEEKLISLRQFKGKVLLILNTASECGLKSQFEELNKLKESFAESEFEILAFPSNQFKQQEPLSGKELCEKYQTQWEAKYQVFARIDVKGKNKDPIFSFLTSKLGGILGLKEIKWNFTKFLIDQEGLPVKRYGPTFSPLKIKKDIARLLANDSQENKLS